MRATTWPSLTREPDSASSIRTRPRPASEACTTGAATLAKLRALIDPLSRTVLWMPPRVARTVRIGLAATGDCAERWRKNHAGAATATRRIGISHFLRPARRGMGTILAADGCGLGDGFGRADIADMAVWR